MNVRIIIDAGSAGLQISSAMAEQPVGTAAPDEVVKALLLGAWEMMLTKTIAAALAADKRVLPADGDILRRLPRLEG